MNQNEIREKVVEILTDVESGIDYERETLLIDKGLLDSFDIITLVGELEDAFGIQVSAVDLVPGNFNSADVITALVLRLSVKEN